MKISEIKTKDKKAYKDFFMNALLQDGDKFRISPIDEYNSPFPTRDKEDSFTLGCYVDDQLVGVASFERDGITREKLRHKGILFRMYVAPEYQGKGIGKRLVAAVIDRARALKNMEQINLTVITTNETAKRLYEGAGFKSFAKEINAIKWKDNYFTEEQMSLKL